MKLDTRKLQYLCFVTIGKMCVCVCACVRVILQNSEILFLKLKMGIVPYKNILKSLTCYTSFM